MHLTLDRQQTLIAAGERSPAQALVIGVRGCIEALKFAANWNLPTELVGAQVQRIQISELRQLLWDASGEFIIVQIQERQLLQLA